MNPINEDENWLTFYYEIDNNLFIGFIGNWVYDCDKSVKRDLPLMLSESELKTYEVSKEYAKEKYPEYFL